MKAQIIGTGRDGVIFAKSLNDQLAAFVLEQNR